MFARPSLVLALVFALLAAAGSGQPAAAQTGQACFPETTQCVRGRFRQYWDENGGLAVFGFPISVAGDELNRDTGQRFLTQWFERNRFELHPENQPPYDVLLGRLGDDRLRQMGRDWQAERRESGPKQGCLWFEQTGHNVCDQRNGLGFRSYWETHGIQDGRLNSYGKSLALFGLPLTEPKVETNPDGDTVLTQWFERARFEWHPDQPDRFTVLLGRLGNETRPRLPGTAHVDVQGFAFNPGLIQVIAGSTVIWTNRDLRGHTATHGTPTAPGGVFDSGILTQGRPFSFTFTQPGDYPYYCQPHPQMQGLIRVVGP